MTNFSSGRIHEWQPTTLHAKTFVVDGEMNRLFLADLLHATEITGAEFRWRSWCDRLAERGANWLKRIP